jgi:NAD(P)-dependent dehydrogenase (short-subunit alcohol dehydrogenase family)
MDKLLLGKNVLITGAGRNIGKGIAIEMAKEGANIFFTDLDKKIVNDLQRELRQYPVESKGFLSDISKTEDNESLCRSLQEERITVDILVNNVGVHPSPDAGTMREPNSREWKEVFDTNVFGPTHLTELISQMMVPNNIQGSILFITSIHQWTVRRFASYSASKAALGMIIKELAVELAPYKIRVNGIAPGYVAEDGRGRAVSHRYTPLHSSSISPAYIGRAAVYLSADYFSKFTTGTVLKIDAGLSLYNHLLEQMPLERKDTKAGFFKSFLSRLPIGSR